MRLLKVSKSCKKAAYISFFQEQSLVWLAAALQRVNLKSLYQQWKEGDSEGQLGVAKLVRSAECREAELAEYRVSKRPEMVGEIVGWGELKRRQSLTFLKFRVGRDKAGNGLEDCKDFCH